MPAPPAAPDLVSLETPGTNDRVSVGPNGIQLEGFRSDSPAISANGRYVAYHFHYQNQSAAGAILSEDGIIRFDRRTRTPIVIWPQRSALTTTVVASAAPGITPSISADGSQVAFVVRPTEGASHIAVWDAGTGALSSPFPTDSAWLSASVDEPSLSADGNVMAFRSLISRLGGPGVYVVNRQTGKVTPVATSDPASEEYWGRLDISGNGTVVAFSTSLGLADIPNSDHIAQVWRTDLKTGTVTLLSAATGGGVGSGTSDSPAVNGDGSQVVFASGANDLLAGDQSDFDRVYAWSMAGGLRRISSSTTGGVPTGQSGQPAISANGRYAAFASDAPDIVPGDTTGRPSVTIGLGGIHTAAFVQTYPADVFVVDLVSGRTSRVSVGRGPAEAQGTSAQPALSSTGRYVAFASDADNLVAKDTNKAVDVFVRDRTPGLSLTPSPLDFGSVTPGPPGASKVVTLTSTGSSGATVTGDSITGANAGDWFAVADQCKGRTIYPGETCTIQLLFVATAAGARAATLRVVDNAPGSPHQVPLTGKSGAGSVVVDPVVGPTGTVTVATGTGFPPNAQVVLTWSAGITPTQLVPVVTDANGGFVAQVLVMPHDRSGKRQLRVAISLPGLTLPPATAAFLVVDGSAVPPTSGLIQVFTDALGRPIILRR